MPNRILNSSICTSDSIDELDFFQESFFYRLLVSVDDYGNFDARAKIIRAAVFPLKDVSLKDIETALDALERQGMLQFYTVNGRRYIHLTGWTRFQRLRNSKHKYPAPDSDGAEIQTLEAEELDDIEELEPEEEEETESIEEDSKDEENERETEENVENEQKDELNGEKPATLIAKTTGQDEGNTADYIDQGLYLRPVCDNSPQLAATRGELATTGGNLRLARAQNPNPNPNPNTNPNTKDIMSGFPDAADGVSAAAGLSEPPEPPKKAPHTSEAREVIDYLNLKTGSKYRYSQSSMRHILARLGEGFSVEECKMVIDKKCNEWLQDPYMSKFLRPETLFAGKFEGYLNQQMQPPGGVRLRQREPVDDDLPF